MPPKSTRGTRGKGSAKASSSTKAHVEGTNSRSKRAHQDKDSANDSDFDPNDQDYGDDNDDDDDDYDLAEVANETAVAYSKPIQKKRRGKSSVRFEVSLEHIDTLLGNPGTDVDMSPSGAKNSASDTLAEGSSSASGMATSTQGGKGSSSVGLQNINDIQILPGTVYERMAPLSAPVPRKKQEKKKEPAVPKKSQLRRSETFPSMWKYAYQGPTIDDIQYVSMTEEALRETVYPKMTCNVKEFRVVREAAELDEYLPMLSTTRITLRGENLDMPTMEAQYHETTDRMGVSDFYLLSTGLSVWALDWCPLPSFKTQREKNINYVAIGGFPDTAENCIARDQLYPLGKQDSQPNMIQFWSINCQTDKEGRLDGGPSGYLDMCFLHNFGAVLDLKWCPTGNYLEAKDDEIGAVDRLGILVGSFTDGSIRIFNVPHPGSLRKALGMEPMDDGTNPETLFVEALEPFVTIRLGESSFMSVCWGTCERLAACCTNGTIAVWDMKSMLSQSKETLAEKDSEYLDPIYLPQVHDVAVRAVDWFRSDDPKEIPWVLISSGYDGRVRYTDLHDMHSLIDVKTILGVPMTATCIPWAQGGVYIDYDQGAKLDQLYVESRGFRLFSAKGTIWDMSYSDYQPFVAAAISDGHVKLTNPTYKAKRGYGMVQVNLYQLQDISKDSTTNNSNTEPVSVSLVDDDEEMKEVSALAGEGASTVSSQQIRDEVRPVKDLAFQYLEGEEREYSSKNSSSLIFEFYAPNVAIQKVQWSKCFHSAGWLASASAGGLVRIDNTVLQSKESGKSNQIHYEPDAYIIRRRQAMNDSEGPKKLGRPRKHPEGSKSTKSRGTRGRGRGRGRGKAGSTRGGTGGGRKGKDDGDDEDQEEDEEAADDNDDDDDDDEEDDDGGQAPQGKDDDDFVARPKKTANGELAAATTVPSSEGRRSARLAPIFETMMSRIRTATQPIVDDTLEEMDDEEREESGAKDNGEAASTKVSAQAKGKGKAKAPAATLEPETVFEPTLASSSEPQDSAAPPQKRRGRPPKNATLAGVEKGAAVNQTLFSRMAISSTKDKTGANLEASEGANIVTDADGDVDMRDGQDNTKAAEQVVEEAGSGEGGKESRTETIEQESAQTSELNKGETMGRGRGRGSGRGRGRGRGRGSAASKLENLRTLQQAVAGEATDSSMTEPQQAQAQTFDIVSPPPAAAAAGGEEEEEGPAPPQQQQQYSRATPTPSLSRTSSSNIAPPDSPRKKRGPNIRTRRKEEELVKTNQSLRAMWGAGSATTTATTTAKTTATMTTTTTTISSATTTMTTTTTEEGVARGEVESGTEPSLSGTAQAAATRSTRSKKKDGTS